jgi:hypothetical protein
MGFGLILIWLLIVFAVVGLIWALIAGFAQKGHSLDEPPQSGITKSPPDPANQQQLRGIDQS